MSGPFNRRRAQRNAQSGQYIPPMQSREEVEAEMVETERKIDANRAFRASHSRGKAVHAYEDNSGRVYVYGEGDESAYEGLPHAPGESFRGMADAIDTGDAASFSTETMPASAVEGRHLATYQKGQVTHHVEADEVSRTLGHWLGFE